jgi:hypothetical protein
MEALTPVAVAVELGVATTNFAALVALELFLFVIRLQGLKGE